MVQHADFQGGILSPKYPSVSIFYHSLWTTDPRASVGPGLFVFVQELFLCQLSWFPQPSPPGEPFPHPQLQTLALANADLSVHRAQPVTATSFALMSPGQLEGMAGSGFSHLLQTAH